PQERYSPAADLEHAAHARDPTAPPFRRTCRAFARAREALRSVRYAVTLSPAPACGRPQAAAQRAPQPRRSARTSTPALSGSMETPWKRLHAAHGSRLTLRAVQ